MLPKIKSNLRNLLKSILRIIMPNELFRKRFLVSHNNLFYYLNIFKFQKTNDIFDYKVILKSKYYKCHEYYKGNFFYGISSNLRKYANYNKPIKACIEHGVYFGDYFKENEAVNSGLPAIFTFSENRKKHLKKVTNKPIFTIGPYISYAESIYSYEEIRSVKMKLGKTLLVFPMHSIERIKSNFDTNGFIDEIVKFKEKYDFQSVLVCLYWKDIELGRDKVYSSYGFQVVSAGYREDPSFLGRLKTFIEISDYTLSNSVGTHIGYCIAMGKPHTVIEQETEYLGTLIDVNGESFTTNSNKIEKADVKKVFDKYSNFISDEQKQICNKYWGIDKIKSKEELELILEICDSIYLKAKKKEELFDQSILEIKSRQFKDIKILNDAL